MSKIDYSENYDVPVVKNQQGEQIKLSDYQKNALYNRAKELKGKLQEGLCTRDECNIPNERNVQKMLNSEFKIKKEVEEYKKCMKAIGADAREINIERIRR